MPALSGGHADEPAGRSAARSRARPGRPGSPVAGGPLSVQLDKLAHEARRPLPRRCATKHRRPTLAARPPRASRSSATLSVAVAGARQPPGPTRSSVRAHRRGRRRPGVRTAAARRDARRRLGRQLRRAASGRGPRARAWSCSRCRAGGSAAISPRLSSSR
jgi:hypothetical protein